MNESDLERLEQTIFNAGSYVKASDDLRPRLVEKAKDRKRQQRIARRWSVGVLACAVVWSVSIPVYHSLSPLRDQVTAPFPDEVEKMALELSTQRKRVGSWGMVDAFTQIRILPKSFPDAAQSEVQSSSQPAPQQ